MVRLLKSTSMVCLMPACKSYITIPIGWMKKWDPSGLHNLSFGGSATEHPHCLPAKFNRPGLGNSWLHNGRGSHRVLQAFFGNHMQVLLPQQSEEQHSNHQKRSDIKLNPCQTICRKYDRTILTSWLANKPIWASWQSLLSTKTKRVLRFGEQLLSRHQTQINTGSKMNLFQH